MLGPFGHDPHAPIPLRNLELGEHAPDHGRGRREHDLPVNPDELGLRPGRVETLFQIAGPAVLRRVQLRHPMRELGRAIGEAMRIVATVPSVDLARPGMDGRAIGTPRRDSSTRRPNAPWRGSWALRRGHPRSGLGAGGGHLPDRRGRGTTGSPCRDFRGCPVSHRDPAKLRSSIHRGPERHVARLPGHLAMLP
jgi:hypothetical protein